MFVNRVEHELNSLDYLKYFCGKYFSYPWQTLPFPLLFLQDPHFELDTPLRYFSPETIHSFPYRVNVRGVYFTWWHTYFGMDRVVVTCYQFTYDIWVTLCVISCEVFIHLCFQGSVKIFNNGTLYVRIVSCMKINVLTFKLHLQTKYLYLIE